MVLARRRTCTRAALFVGLILGASALALMRLHVTGGYCTTRHGLIPGMLLTVTAGGGVSFLASRLTIPGRWVRLDVGRVGIPAPAWSLAIVVLLASLNAREGTECPEGGPFAVYDAAATWLQRNTIIDENVLDMTDWSLYLSGRSGYRFADVYKAMGDRAVRWIVVREPHVDGRWPYSKVIRDFIGGRQPAALIPRQPSPGQLQIRIYDRHQPESGRAIARTDELSSNKARPR